MPVSFRVIRKAHDKEVSGDGNEAGDDPLHDENPPPACVATKAGHLHQAVGEDPSECRGHAADEVKDRVALVHVVATIPGTAKYISLELGTSLELKLRACR